MDRLTIQSYWTQVLDVLGKVGVGVVVWSPFVALLRYVKDIPKPYRRLIAIGLVIAKRRLAMRWIKGPCPTLQEWQSDMLYCSTQLDNYMEMMPIHRAPRDIWGPYRLHLLSVQEDPVVLPRGSQQPVPDAELVNDMNCI